MVKKVFLAAVLGVWMNIALVSEGHAGWQFVTSTSFTDEEGEVPKVNSSTTNLQTRLRNSDPTKNHFSLYFNECTSPPCSDEKITRDDAKNMARYLQCSWDLFLSRDMSPSTRLLFKDPTTSEWADVTGQARIPVWIHKHSGSASGGNGPNLTFPATTRINNPVTANAIHEFAHVVIKGYPDFLAGGFIDFVNEGLPTFFEQVLRDEIHYPEVGSGNREECHPKQYIDLSNGAQTS